MNLSGEKQKMAVERTEGRKEGRKWRWCISFTTVSLAATYAMEAISVLHVARTCLPKNYNTHNGCRTYAIKLQSTTQNPGQLLRLINTVGHLLCPFPSLNGQVMTVSSFRFTFFYFNSIFSSALTVKRCSFVCVCN